MGSHEKLLARFLSRPKDFTYRELKRLLKGFDYKEDTKGRTSGSRVAFKNPSVKRPILVHKPHPDKGIKLCYLIEIEKELRERGFINEDNGI